VHPCAVYVFIHISFFSRKDDGEGYRPIHLSPPPTNAQFKKPLSPLRPIDNMPTSGKGLERERFEALLKASRERNAMVGAKKTNDLRKEIALKGKHSHRDLSQACAHLSIYLKHTRTSKLKDVRSSFPKCLLLPPLLRHPPQRHHPSPLPSSIIHFHPRV
jgi:hypothetical protein